MKPTFEWAFFRLAAWNELSKNLMLRLRPFFGLDPPLPAWFAPPLFIRQQNAAERLSSCPLARRHPPSFAFDASASVNAQRSHRTVVPSARSEWHIAEALRALNHCHVVKLRRLRYSGAGGRRLVVETQTDGALLEPTSPLRGIIAWLSLHPNSWPEFSLGRATA
jgi:hypothetical protein